MSQTSAKDLVETPLPEDIDEPHSFECRVCGDLVDPPAAGGSVQCPNCDSTYDVAGNLLWDVRDDDDNYLLEDEDFYEHDGWDE